MRSRILPMALLCTVAGVSPLAGQSTARGRVRLVIRPVLHLETASTEAETVEAGDRVEVRGAVRVRVSSNAPWRLVVRARWRPAAGSMSAEGRDEALWVRATPGASGFAQSLARGYTLVAADRLAVAEGAPGAGQEVILDYRWDRTGMWPGPEGPEDLVVELTER